MRYLGPMRPRLCLVLLPALFGTPGVQAQQEVPEELTPLLGTWVNISPDGGRAAIEQAIESGVEPMGFLKEHIAKGRLLDNNPPIPRLVIQRSGSAIEVQLGPTLAYAAPLGKRAKGRSPEGDEVVVKHDLRSDALVQRVSAGSSGHSTMVYRTDESAQRLKMTMTIESPHLPKPIRYTLRFGRAG